MKEGSTVRIQINSNSNNAFIDTELRQPTVTQVHKPTVFSALTGRHVYPHHQSN